MTRADCKVKSARLPLSGGTRLGHSEILDAVGIGGMGEVYRAADTKLHATSL